jgi:hypothetical protein
VPLAHRAKHVRRSVVVVIVAALLGLDVDIDGVRDGLVCAARFVLVDGRPIVVEASLVAPVGGGLDRRGLPSW